MKSLSGRANTEDRDKVSAVVKPRAGTPSAIAPEQAKTKIASDAIQKWNPRIIGGETKCQL
jgi:hypothetical protein